MSYYSFIVTEIDSFHADSKSEKLIAHKHPEEINKQYWNDKAQNEVRSKINQKQNTNHAKNVIIFLGDGMSLATVTASRILVENEEGLLSFEKFPHFGLSKTYCTDSQVADSACSATAYLNGVKGNIGTIGVNAQVPRYSCDKGTKDDIETHTESIASWAQKACKSTGIVTTTPVTDASPSGNYAHIANRGWENDAEIVKSSCDPEKIDDIAKQLIHGDVGKNFKVILGGGRSQFLPKTEKDDDGFEGLRTDNKNLIKDFLAGGSNRKYVSNNRQLRELDYNSTDSLLGLFAPDFCEYQSDIKKYHLEDTDPSLLEMVEAALKILMKDQNGFYLFVEGGKIDIAHHENQARKSLRETEEFAKAIELARHMTNIDDTLIIVTADHAHTMTINGYPVCYYNFFKIFLIIFIVLFLF